jgi:ribose transport system substrate-binding protein
MVRKWTLAVIVVALAATACSTGGSSTTKTTSNGSGGALSAGSGGLPENVQAIDAEKFANNAIKGKKIYYAALGSGYALEDQWRNVFHDSFTQLGAEYKENVADVDPQRLAQNAQSLLNGKPDVLIVHAGDSSNLNSLIKAAHAQGIYVFNLNLMTSQAVDGYVGGNFNIAEAALAKSMAEDCTKRGKKKVAIIGGFPGDGLSLVAIPAYEREFKAAGLEVVANQPQSYDATKAHDMAVTVMQQHPDLCGFIGTWDNMMIGAANAVKQANKVGQVVVYTSDSSVTGCKAVADGTITKALDYGVGVMGEQIVALVQYYLQTKIPAGSTRVAVFPRFKLLDKSSTLSGGSCYTGKPL